MNWRAEPANTPLVEQAPMALVFVGRALVGTKEGLLAWENEPRRPTGEAEVFERLLPAREMKLRGCRRVVWVPDMADWGDWTKRGASTNAE